MWKNKLTKGSRLHYPSRRSCLKATHLSHSVSAGIVVQGFTLEERAENVASGSRLPPTDSISSRIDHGHNQPLVLGAAEIRV